MPLLAVLNIDGQKSISWFKECVAIGQVIFETPYVDDFLHYALYRDYDALQPVIDMMLSSTAPKVVETAARRVCVAALDIEAAEADAQRIRAGSSIMRKAAADVYSTNVAHDVVRASCRRLLRPFFGDPDESVRAEAASAFRELANLATADQGDLIAAFLDGMPTSPGLNSVVAAIEQSPVELPDLVCLLAEVCVDAYRRESKDGSAPDVGIAMDLSKIVVRLYAQTGDSEIRVRCLDLIDEMEHNHFMGLSSELQLLDR